jgi:hypothetical protein
MYLMKVIPETYHVQLIRYLCFFHKNILNVAIKSHKSKQTMEKNGYVFLNDYHTSTIKQT